MTEDKPTARRTTKKTEKTQNTKVRPHSYAEASRAQKTLNDFLSACSAGNYNLANAKASILVQFIQDSFE